MVPVLKIPDVAARLAMSEDAVLNLITTKQLIAMNVAVKKNSMRPSWRIRPDDLEAFELSRRTIKPLPTSSTRPAKAKYCNERKHF